MMKKNNPFTLTFGKQPTEYISRYEDTERVISTFEADQPISQAYLLEGIRGSGKTVLMTAISNALQQQGGWIVADLNATQDLLHDLAMRLTDACRRLPDLMKSGFSFSVAGFGVGINGTALPEDDISTIEHLLDGLKKKRKVLITIDEVIADKNMRRFASQFQIFLRQGYPVFLLMTGLYENIYAIQNDPALTFLLRTPKIRLDPLSIPQIGKQYARIFQLDTEQAMHLARITKGYAFAFQALGVLYFEYADRMPLEDILSQLDDMLDDFVYKKIWESLSGKDREIILSMPEDEIRVGDLCQRIKMTSGAFSRYRDRLIRRGIIAATRHGYVELLLPRFSIIAKSYTM